MTPTHEVQIAASPPAQSESPPGQSPPTPETTRSRLEVGGPRGPDPTRYGDWELRGRCIDF
ncbi:MAG: succinate dehydrogenase assembly factor 4 [Steroidobacteraceae bacterium]